MLDVNEQPAMESHIEGCSTCKNSHERYRAMERGFHQPVPVPADFTYTVMKRIENHAFQWSFALILLVLLLALLAVESVPTAFVASTGDLFSSLISVIKNLHVLELLGAFFSQNMIFLAGYSLCIVSLIAVYSIFKTRKQLHSGVLTQGGII
jgi:hypothetical protein